MNEQERERESDERHSPWILTLKMAEAVENLPESQREAIRLHYLEGLKLSEVAEITGKSSGAVAGLLHRGMKTLRQQLADR